MRIKLLNVECEFQVPVVFGRRNVYVTTVDTAASTSDMNNIAFRLCAMGYQSIHVTSQRTGNNETKAYPTIRICLLITLTGDCLSRNAQTSYAKCPLRVINPKPSKGKGDDAEYPIWQRSRHSSLRTGKPFTWRRAAAYELNIDLGRCVRHYEKSRKDVEQSDKTQSPARIQV